MKKLDALSLGVINIIITAKVLLMANEIPIKNIIFQ